MSGMLMVRRQARRPHEIGLFAVDDLSFDELMKVPSEKTSLVNAKSPRNPKHHALAWALATKLAEACDWLHDAEDAMTYLKVRARHVTWVTNPMTGEAIARPKSIAFASLDQVHFARVFDRFVWIITNEILPGIEEDALRAEILKMVEGIKNTPQQHQEAPHQHVERDTQRVEHDPETGEVIDTLDVGTESREAGQQPLLMDLPAEAPETELTVEETAAPISNLSDPDAGTDGSDGREERDSRPTPESLSSNDREILQLFVDSLDGERSGAGIMAVKRNFWGANPPTEGSALAAATNAIFEAHKQRVKGEITIAECDRLCREARQ